MFAAAADFSWTYIKTHENDWCGPYFYRKKQSSHSLNHERSTS
ncbi:MAG: DUF4275 family protein [Clostridia bacterium]|nr:DUF4275 family protein [Clostridia bacterium]